jgi:hypothetical protein
VTAPSRIPLASRSALAGAALVACLVASVASAAGFNVSWNNCAGEGTGANNKAFACGSNIGTNVLVISFVLGADLAQVNGNEIVLDVLTQAPTLPDWWAFKDDGSCRQFSLGFNSTANAGDVVCVDWGAGQSAGGIGSYNQELVPIDPALIEQHRRLKVAVAVPLAAVADLVANTEYFSCNLTIDNEKTVGSGACAGCTEPMCIVLNVLRVTSHIGIGENDVVLGTGASPGSNIVTWQGPGPNCQAVPTRNATWGAVKALYR